MELNSAEDFEFAANVLAERAKTHNTNDYMRFTFSVEDVYFIAKLKREEEQTHHRIAALGSELEPLLDTFSSYICDGYYKDVANSIAETLILNHPEIVVAQ